jgi:hypothetical protein
MEKISVLIDGDNIGAEAAGLWISAFRTVVPGMSVNARVFLSPEVNGSSITYSAFDIEVNLTTKGPQSTDIHMAMFAQHMFDQGVRHFVLMSHDRMVNSMAESLSTQGAHILLVITDRGCNKLKLPRACFCVDLKKSTRNLDMLQNSVSQLFDTCIIESRN